MLYHIHKKLQDAAIWNMTYFKRSDKGQYQNCPRFWCGEYLCKITKWYRQFLQSYRVHNAAWPWGSSKVQKGHTKVNVEHVRDFYVENIHVKLSYNMIQAIYEKLLRSQGPPRCCQMFITVTQRSRSNLVEILMIKISLTVQLQHDAGKFWCFNIFTRSCKMLPFEHDLFQKVKKVRQRSTSN